MSSVFEIGHRNSVFLQVSPRGAELRSLQVKGREWIWGAKAPWTRSSPWLFPVIGRLLDDAYEHEGRVHGMGQHGFLRDREFVLVEKAENFLKLKYSSAGEENYPFAFAVEIEFSLEAHDIFSAKKGSELTNEIHISVVVSNHEKNRQLPFSLGWHPGFLKAKGVDLKGSSSSGESLNYSQSQLSSVGHFTKAEMKKASSQILKFADLGDLKTAHVFQSNHLESLSLLSSEGEAKLNFQLAPAPKALAIWSSAQEQFICVEPWWGLPEAGQPFSYSLAPGQSQIFSIRLRC